ncbi:glycoside hydrolase family 5 protein [Thalassobellus citreus]|uniref:glycoside hydrolase family 5 protein n=1 Tax=Thalassobellus citreus TaxID=3367752 RepID=UPI0037B289C3
MKNIKRRFILGVCFLFVTLSFSQNKLDRISVNSNNFIIENGETIIFRGLNTSDPDKLEIEGHWNKSYFKQIKKWGANIVRFPVHPTAWTKRGEDNYLKLLDKGIKWATQLNLYVIIDWHSIGNLQTEMYQHERYNTTLKETYDFWDIISKKYGKNTTVAFYELFNEPTTYNNTLGTASWETWKEMNEKMIAIIRNNGGEGIPLIAGFNWAYDLTPVINNPIKAKDIAYVSHPYPEKREKPWEQQWTTDWGFVKEKHPLILTEIGFCGPEDPGAHNPVISDESYGDAITNYSDEKEISYIVWVFDPEWAPRLFKDWKYTPSRHGKYFKKKLQSYKYN